MATPKAADQVRQIRASLGQIRIGGTEEDVPSVISGKITQLKDALSSFTDTELSCAPPSLQPEYLKKVLALSLHANRPAPAPGGSPKVDDSSATYGDDLRVDVVRPKDVPDLLAVQYSFDIVCGEDTMLLVYELQDGSWVQKLRWQAPPLKSISEAFGNFFLFGFLTDTPSNSAKSPAATAASAGPSSPSPSTPGPSTSGTSTSGEEKSWRLVVAHGTPWCTSRFSNFKMDLLAPGSIPETPKVEWHTNRPYSIGDFETRLKTSGDTFELRLNADDMDFDPDHGFERHVIYRYKVDPQGKVQRINPLGSNARGFVAEWIMMPWQEAEQLSESEAAPELQRAHDRYRVTHRDGSEQSISHTYGPVRACSTPKTFQVQIDSSSTTTVQGKPGTASQVLPSHYFHVREAGDGYRMISAPTTPDPQCSGPDLMPAQNK